MTDTPKPGGLSPLKRAFLALEAAETKLAAVERAAQEPIAIVGIGCRFPGRADSPEAFWRNLRTGSDAIAEVPPERWDIERYYDPNPEAPGKMTTRWGGFIAAVDRFDAESFGITPREARSMDPQQRLLMEVAREALANAGHARLEELEGSATGVFVGIATDDYAQMQMAAQGLAGIDTYFVSGAARSIASGRLSYYFGFHGPAVSLDTACSSSLLAVHQACRSLKDGECRMALAAGVNLILAPANTVALSKYQMMAPDGRCKAFDAAADGFVRGEGCGVVVLKRLGDALADRDHVYALIMGSATNQDGPSSGLTVPNGPAQEAVIRAALARAGIQPSQVDYIEAHGTGTALGDPIEVRALGACFNDGRPPERPLLIGSVKTNIGHLEAASGIAGLIKAALVLHHREIPPSLHFQRPNPNIDWEGLAIRVATEATSLAHGAGRLHAGVTALGFSGTNVHIVLASPPAAAAPPDRLQRPRHVITLSARTEAQLRAGAAELAQHLAADATGDPGDIGFTLNLGRTHERHRLALTVASTEELQRGLSAVAGGQAGAARVATLADGAAEPRIAFLFTGQGAQYAGMGRTLYAHLPVVRQCIDQSDEVLRPLLGRSIRDVLFPATASDEPLIHQTLYTQPALFVLEYALARMWLAWGVKPAWVLGHSLGEYVAACVADVFPLPDALKMVVTRAQVMQSSAADGEMWAIMAPEHQVAEGLAGYTHAVSIAAVNGPRQVVISGRGAEVRAVSQAFQAQGLTVARLNVSHAFHSPLMEPLLDRFESALAGIAFHPPRLPLISNVSGAAAEPPEITTPAYWRRHMRAPVRFLQSIQTLAAAGGRLFLEIGPQPVLAGMGRAILNDAGTLWLPTLNRRMDDWQSLLAALAELYLAGTAIDWAAFDAPYARRRLPLSGSVWDRRRYWFSGASLASRNDAPDPAEAWDATEDHPLLGRRLDSATGRILFRARLGTAADTFFGDHRVAGGASLPMAAMLEAAGAAARRIGLGRAAVALRNARMDMAIDLPERAAVDLEWAFEPDGNGGYGFKLFSRSGQGAWVLHAEGEAAGGGAISARTESLSALRQRCARTIDPEAFYSGFASVGLDFGPAFRSVEQIWIGVGEALGRLRSDPVDTSRYDRSPLLLDAALQMIAAALLPDASPPRQRLFLPVGVDRVDLFPTAGTQWWGHAVLREPPGDQTRALSCDVRLMDAEGRVAAELSGCRLLAVEAGALAAKRASAERLLYDLRWIDRSTEGARRAAAPPPDGFRPALAAAAEAVRRRLPEVAARHQLARYDDELRRIDARVRGHILQAFAALGWRPDPRAVFRAEDLAADLQVAGRHHRLLRRFLDILAEDGVLRPQADGWTAVADAGMRPSDGAPPSGDDTALAAIESDLVERCGRRLAQALRGEVDVLDLIYQGDGFEAVTRLYTASVTARIYNHLLAEAIGQAFRGWPRQRRLRVLEIGGGTGGSTQAVLKGLAGAACNYLFTDVSPAFVQSAAERFRDREDFSARSLDIEKAPGDQALAGRQFDLVVAANVVHATADLAATLRHIRQLTAPGGVVVLLEVTVPQRWIDITFGLTTGWWKFTDARLRNDYPLISADRWLRLLESQGFTDAVAVPSLESGAISASLGRESILMARRPGPAAADGRAPEGRLDWLILADDGGLGGKIGQRLEAMGLRSAAVASQGDAPSACRSRDDFHRLLAAGPLGGSASDPPEYPAKVLYLWALEDRRRPAAAEDDPLKRVETLVTPLLGLVQALSEAPAGRATQLVLVTRAGQAVDDRDPTDPAATLLWGMLRGVMLEHPELRCKLIDLEADASPDVAGQLLDECLAEDAEDQVALRAAGVFVPRLAEAPSAEAPGPPSAADAPQRLDITQRGVLENLYWRPLESLAPGPGQVKIAVQAAGLNFRDVLNALGMYAGGAVPLGGECAGVVTAVGPGVVTPRPGDRVMAIGAHCFSSEVVTHALLTAPVPDGLESERAAGLPIAYVTAAYALETLARLKKGTRVLIHAAAGGVGLAAVHLARGAGAEVFATAGNPEKRLYLERLGVRQVMNSRDPAFADQVMAATGGKGVDVVLNSLAGEFIPQSLRVTAAGGTFIELGRAQVLSAGQARELRPDVTYHPVDLTDDMDRHPERIAPILEGVLARMAGGALPVLPCRVFPRSAVVEAFRFMSRARHIGKLTLAWPRKAAAPSRTPLARPDGTYWITGGLGALGLFTAEWLAQQGAGHLLLTGRSGPTADAEARIARLREGGTRVSVSRSDVASPAAVEAIVAGLAADRAAPLRGIVHAAGRLDDGVLRHQNWSRFATVLQAKAAGAWHLHQATRHLALDFFVLYSSVSAVLGSPGQTNHCAANAFMDGLAHLRRSLGLRGTSINWGAWGGAGAALERTAAARAAIRGVERFAPADGLRLLERLIREDAVQAVALAVEWRRFLHETYPGGPPPLLSRITPSGGAAPKPRSAMPAAKTGILERLDAALPAQRQALLAGFVHEETLRILGREASESIDPDKPLNDLGLDSLMAVELRNALGQGLGRALSATLLFDYPTLGTLTTFLAGELALLPDKAPDTAEEPPPDLLGTDDLLSRIENLRDDDIDRLMRK